MKSKILIYGWLMWLLAALFYALDYFQHTAPSVLLQPIAHTLQVPYTTVGSIMSIYFPIYAIMQLPAGYCLDRLGVRYTLSMACCVVSIGLLSNAVPSISALIIGRALIASGSAFAFLGALKTASAWLPRSTFAVAVGLTNTIGVMGGLLGQPFLNWLIERMHWQKSILLISAFGFVLTALIAILLRSPASPRGLMQAEHDYYQAMKDKQTWILALYAGIMVGTVVNAFSELYDVVFLEKSFLLTSEKAAAISSMIFIGIAVGGPLHGFIARGLNSLKRWMLCANLATLICFCIIVFSSQLHLPYSAIYVLYFLTGFFVSSMLLSFSMVRGRYHQKLHAVVFAIINMTIGICGFIFQYALGELLHYLGQHAINSAPQTLFIHAFWFLLIPLIASFFLCCYLRQDNDATTSL